MSFCASLLSAQTLYWVGESGNWNDPQNWAYSPGGSPANTIPSYGNPVVIPPDYAAELRISGKAMCKGLSCLPRESRAGILLDSGAELESFGSLELCDSLLISGGTIVFRQGVCSLFQNGASLHSSIEVSGASLEVMGGLALGSSASLTIESGKLISGSQSLVSHTFYLAENGFWENGNTPLYCYNPGGLSLRGAIIPKGKHIVIYRPVGAEYADRQWSESDERIEFNYRQLPTCATGPGQTPFTIDAIVISNYNGEDISCNGANDGIATVNVSGGIGPFIYQWIGGDLPGFTQNYSNLGAGTYTVLVTDLGQGVTCVDNVQLAEPPPITIFSLTLNPPSCEDLCNGSAFPIAIGGVPSYDYLWSSGETGFQAVQLCEGSNSVIITDSNGCSFDSTFQLIREPIDFGLVVSEILCAGESTGEASANPSGGAGGPFAISWSNGQSGPSATGLSAQSYILTVTDAANCTVDTTFTVTELPGIEILEEAIIDESCAGNLDGSISVSVAGGASPYNVLWSGPDGFSSVQEDISALGAGAYTLTVTDANGCEEEAVFMVEAPPSIELSAMVTEVDCPGEFAGSIDLTVNGGTAPFGFEWTGPGGFTGFNEDLNSLGAGIYTVTVTDALMCSESAQFEVTEPEAITAIETITPVSCADENDGAIAIDLSGGSAPYNFSWAGPGGFSSSNEDLVGLESGSYMLTITDANSCSIDLSFVLDEPAPISAEEILQEPSCAESTDGAIDITIAGGQSPYVVSWTGPNGYSSSSEDISGLIQGTYSLEITDAAGCVLESDYTLDAPQPLLITAVVTDISCGGLQDGSIDLSITGGTAPYFVQWDGPNGLLSGSEDINLLDNGMYDLTVTDSQGCEAMEAFEVSENPPLEAVAVVSPVDCAGNANGSIDLSPSGGTLPYNFAWTGPNGFTASTEDISGLQPGDYNLDIIDANDCLFEITFTLDEPEQIQILADVSPITCPGAADASISSSAEGGVSPYNYSWTGPGGFTSSSANIGPLGPGIYTLTVTDASGCESEAEFVLSDPTPLVLIPVITDISCGGLSDGAIELSVLGGTPGYTFSWAGPNGFSSDQEDIGNLSQGTYQLDLTDNAGCSVSASYEVAGQDILETSPEITSISCFGDADGAIVLNIAGGVSPYTVNWTGPGGFLSDQEDISGLPAGTYQYSIVDFNGCTLDGSAEITEPQQIQVVADVTDPSCFGLNDGSIVLNISGGNAPYSVSWSGGQSGETLLNLGAGTYNATVTDNTGCVFLVNPLVLEDSTEITVDFAVTNVVCAGEPVGAIDATVSGGEPGYNYEWVGPGGFTSNTEDILGLGEGSYTLTVTDSEGCSVDSGIDITSPEAIDITASLTQPVCAGGTGAIDLSIIGGTGPYTFAWAGPNGFVSAQEDIANLSEGSYQVLVTDANDCFGQASFDIQSLNPILIQATVTPVDCSGDDNGSIELTVSGGTPGYSISWTGPGGFSSSDEDIFSLAQGDYLLSVTDAQSCALDTVFAITEPAELAITAAIVSPLCAQENTGAIDISVAGGFPAYSFSWSGPEGFTSDQEDLSGLNPGDYQLTVSDQGSCVSDTVFTLTEVPGIFIDASLTDILCGGLSSGAIALSVSGGTSPYQFNWSGPNGFSSSEQNIDNLEAGEYDLTLSDANGCSVDTSFTLATPQLIDVVFVVDNPLCGVLNGSVQAQVSGGQVALDYVYEWYDISDGFQLPIGNGPSVNNLGPGLYEFIVTDDNGCFFTDIIPLSDEPGYIEVTTTDLLCPGDANGTISLEIFEGTPPYVISWTGPNGFASSQEDLSNLAGGEYFLVITDANNCEINETVTVLEPAELILDIAVTDVTCNGDDNGSISLVVSGGTEPYTFEWTGDNGFSSNQEDLSDLTVGQYSLLFSDANGCTIDTFALVSESLLLEVSMSYTGTICAGEATGSIDLEVNGGTEPYSYGWNGPGGFNSDQQDLSALAAGDYSLLLLDAEGCFRDTSITIAEASPIDVLLDIIQPSCNESNGSVSATASGGVINVDYSFTWFDLSQGNQALLGTGNSLSNLGNGIYQVEVTDDLGCTALETFNLSDAGGLLEGIINGLSCFNSGDGAIDLSISGGLAPFVIVWSGPNGYSSGAEDVNGLQAGEYAVQVTDALGCGFTALFDVSQPEEIILDIVATNSTCNGTDDGSISVVVSGGTGSIDSNWFGPGGFSANGDQISSLSPECYQLVVQDETGCTADSTICLVEPEVLTLDAAITGILCGGEPTGSIDLMVSGGTPDYSYSWVGPDGFVAGGVEDIAALFAGAYDVLVSDINDCETTATFIVDQNTPLTANPEVTSPLCFGSSDGSIALEVFGGTLPASAEWIGPNGYNGFGLGIDNLEAGEYIWLLSDINGCFVSDTVALSEPGELVIDTLALDITCFGLGNGSIELLISGGTPVYSVFWTGPNGFSSTAEDIFNLEPGSYQFQVGDSNACTETGVLQIDEPLELVLSLDNTVNPSCSNSFDGSIDMDIQGGVPDYGISWTNGLGEEISSGEDISDLGPDVYSVEVTDSNGCAQALADIELIALTTVEALAPGDTVYCEGTGPVLLSGLVSGQDNFGWFDENGVLLSDSLSVLVNPPPGTWFYVLSASSPPCAALDTVYVTVLLGPFADAGEDQFIFPEEIIGIGGNPSVTDENALINWSPALNLDDAGSPNPAVSGLTQDQWYVLTVSDENGCSASDSVLVAIIPEIDIPDGFSPNGDLINDVWEIGNTELYPSLVVEIYNRWGDLLFRSEGYDEPWDGRYNGDLLPIGTYYYIIEFDEPEFSDKITGPLTILR